MMFAYLAHRGWLTKTKGMTFNMKKIFINNDLDKIKDCKASKLLNCNFLILTLILSVSFVLQFSQAYANPPMKYLALDADMSGNTKEAGTSLKRGITLAIKEINESGGINGVKLGLKVFDHRANPARGIYNIHQIASDPDILAIIGGVHTPVALEQLPTIHQYKIPYLGAWAAGTPIVENGYQPNYVFRLSVRDEFAAPFFIKELQNHGYKNVGLFLEKTGWGRSNYKAFIEESKTTDININFTKWFFWGDKKDDFKIRMDELMQHKLCAIVLVANITEGAEFVKALSEIPEEKRPPVISHWGITSGNFHQLSANELQNVDVSFLQTWSLDHENAGWFKEKYCAEFGPCQSSTDFPAPVGTAHSYDLTHLFSKALAKTNNMTREELWSALQQIEHHEGLIKTYEYPFTKYNREALGIDDFGLYRYNDEGDIVKSR